MSHLNKREQGTSFSPRDSFTSLIFFNDYPPVMDTAKAKIFSFCFLCFTFACPITPSLFFLGLLYTNHAAFILFSGESNVSQGCRNPTQKQNIW